MSTWGFVSDIHGNIEALRRGVSACEALGASRFVSLGDVIGKGDPEACVAWVRDHAEIAIVGNRDLDYLDRVPQDLQRVVRDWPSEARAANFVASHGDRRLHRVLNSSAERDGFHQVTSYMAQCDAALWFFGHTHRPRIWQVTDGEVHLVSGNLVEIRPGSLYVVNVGTMGLPLPGRGGASCVVYDEGAGLLHVVPLTAGRRGDSTRTRGAASSARILSA